MVSANAIKFTIGPAKNLRYRLRSRFWETETCRTVLIWALNKR